MPDSDGMPGFPHRLAGAFACFFGSVSNDLAETGFVGKHLPDLFANGSGERDHVFGQLLFQIAVADRHIIVGIVEVRNRIGR